MPTVVALQEFFRLIASALSSEYMENECFRHNAMAGADPGFFVWWG